MTPGAAAALVVSSLALVACSSSDAPRPRDAAAASALPPDRWVGPGDATASPVANPPPQDAARGKDFAAEVRLLYRVVACAGDDALPDEIDARVVAAHCAELRPKIDAYRRRYVDVARPFLAALTPRDAPDVAVYPFSGGDLVTALTTYPAAREYTTLSLELTGDPRRIHGLGSQALAQSLAELRREIDELIFVEYYSRSETLKRTQRGEIPGELAFFLVGLAVHGYRPVSLRYFRLEADGAVRYLGQADIDAVDHELAANRKRTWTPPDFSEAFANAEIQFEAAGAKPGEPPKVHRHVAANLANEELAAHPGVLRHLQSKGRVVAMTKAASYLLWADAFSSVRDYLLDDAVFMVSDSTGIPPAFAARAGFTQETYGAFKGSLLHASAVHNAAFRKLWSSSPTRKLPFRYGYRDASGQDHLLVTKKPSQSRTSLREP